MKFYEVRMGEELRAGETGVQVIDATLTLIFTSEDGKTRTYYSTEGRHVTANPQGMALTLKPTLELTKDDTGRPKVTRI